MSKIGVVSLGCAKNLVDTERMMGLLRDAGHSFVSDPAEAGVIIVNTCGFIEPAKQESIDTILEMARYKAADPRKKLIVTGCLSERYRSALTEELPEVDHFLGVREYASLPALLGTPLSASVCAKAVRALSTPPYRAFLRVGDGCNNRCAYCAIPLIRGPLSSVPMDALVDEAKALADGGVSELTVIAQDTSGYGRDLYGKPMLLPLLERLTALDGLHWLRVLYTYPDTVTPELLDAMLQNPKLVPYLDMPLQHISDGILRRMNRRGTQAHIRSLLERIRSLSEDFILRTTMMVGFPGETEADFSELLAFLNEYRFDRVGAFAFSPEEDTPAAAFADQVPEEVKADRLERLMCAQRTISLARNRRRVGQTAEVLIEGEEGGMICARSYAEAPDVDGRILLARARGLSAGAYRTVRLTEAMDYDMIGELI